MSESLNPTAGGTVTIGAGMPSTPEPVRPLTVHPATGCEKVAWIFMAAALFFALYFGLLPALLAGLLMHAVIHIMARQLSGKSLSHGRAKLVAIALIGLVMLTVGAAIVVLLIAFLKGHLGSIPALFNKMAEIIEQAGAKLGISEQIPAADELKTHISQALREHSKELQHIGGEAGHIVVHALIGMVVGALTAFEMRTPAAPLSSALFERIRRFADAFEKVVFAQIKISALNTVITALYLLVALPMFDIHLPLRKTLVLVTFLVGLIPVLGNLASNTAIVVIALGVSAPVAIASLVFLIVIHKLEYFLNARIVGDQIHAAAWEILLAMLCFEAAFGLPGVIIAPIVYAYVKKELTDRALV